MCSVAFKAIYTCIGNKFYFKKDRFLVAYLTDWIKNRHLNLHMKALQCALTPLPPFRFTDLPTSLVCILGCTNKDLCGLCAPIFIIVVYSRTATSYSFRAKK